MYNLGHLDLPEMFLVQAAKKLVSFWIQPMYVDMLLWYEGYLYNHMIDSCSI